MASNGVLKLYVNNKFVVQRKAQAKTTIKQLIDMWKKTYALKKHNYKIYIQIPSKMNDN